MPFQDLRQFLARLEAEDHLRRIRKEVDWNLELSHIAKVNEEQHGGGKALLFENVKAYPGWSVLTSALTARERLALALEMPINASLMNLSREWVERIQHKRVPPRVVDSGPVRQHVVQGDDVDIFKLPAPWFYPGDGGRYLGTAGYLISRNLDTGRLNLGTYRLMMVDRKRASIQMIKAKDGEMDLRGYAAQGIPMPVAYICGAEPSLFLCASTLFGLTESEYEIAGALRGAPVEVTKALTNDILVPAAAELVIEGEIMPGETLQEGPFGEYTGHYSGKEFPKEYINVKAITYRDSPILWSTTVGKPVTDTHMIMAVNRTASLWNDLKAMNIPGIKAVYGPPASAGRMLVIISMKPMYHGHSTQVGLAAFATTTGNYGLKTVILVDEDIDPENMDQVIFALSFKYQPDFGTQIIKRGRSTPLDPSLPIGDARYMTSRIILDCTTPYEWKEKPKPIFLDEKMLQYVKDHWDEYFSEEAAVTLPQRVAEMAPALR
ncbi:MAG: UbiD family decarboxylase [Chloroflexi bacterium]|nr:UbiD family decarboxylase [Chloroflexota bacterium]